MRGRLWKVLVAQTTVLEMGSESIGTILWDVVVVVVVGVPVEVVDGERSIGWGSDPVEEEAVEEEAGDDEMRGLGAIGNEGDTSDDADFWWVMPVLAKGDRSGGGSLPDNVRSTIALNRRA